MRGSIDHQTSSFFGWIHQTLENYWIYLFKLIKCVVQLIIKPQASSWLLIIFWKTFWFSEKQTKNSICASRLKYLRFTRKSTLFHFHLRFKLIQNFPRTWMKYCKSLLKMEICFCPWSIHKETLLQYTLCTRWSLWCAAKLK